MQLGLSLDKVSLSGNRITERLFDYGLSHS
jgi:hypothetical protein